MSAVLTDHALSATPVRCRLLPLALAISLALALLPALWPALDLHIAALFIGDGAPVPAADWGWVTLINRNVPDLARVIAALAFAAWVYGLLRRKSAGWRRTSAFLVLGLVLGPGLAVNLVKDGWQRARPSQVQEFGGVKDFSAALRPSNQCERNCAFVSGHVACAVFLASVLLTQRRRRAWWLAGGVVFTGLVGFSRLAVGAHWLSDALWAVPLVLLTSALAWWLVHRLHPRH